LFEVWTCGYSNEEGWWEHGNILVVSIPFVYTWRPRQHVGCCVYLSRDVLYADVVVLQLREPPGYLAAHFPRFFPIGEVGMVS
jgi:hypothetical protein